MPRTSKRLAAKGRTDYSMFFRRRQCLKQPWNLLRCIQTLDTLDITTFPTRKQLFSKYGLPCSLLPTTVSLDVKIAPENLKGTDYDAAIAEFMNCLQTPFPGRSETQLEVLALQLRTMGFQDCANYLEKDTTIHRSLCRPLSSNRLAFEPIKQYENPNTDGTAFYYGDFKTNLGEHSVRSTHRHGMEIIRQNNAMRKIRYYLQKQESIKHNKSLYATEQEYMNDKCRNVAVMYEHMLEYPDFIAVPEGRNYALAAEYKVYEIHHELATTPTPPTPAVGSHILFATRSYVAMVRHILGILDSSAD
jgi:hypothetical protein